MSWRSSRSSTPMSWSCPSTGQGVPTTKRVSLPSMERKIEIGSESVRTDPDPIRPILVGNRLGSADSGRSTRSWVDRQGPIRSRSDRFRSDPADFASHAPIMRAKAALFITMIEFSERLNYFALSTNLMIYFTTVFHEDLKTAAKIVNCWTGITMMMPLLGGFVADTYLGPFHTVMVSTMIYTVVIDIAVHLTKE